MDGWVGAYNLCVYMYYIGNVGTYTHTSEYIHACVHNNNNNNLYFLYVALFFIRNELTAFGRVVSFEACCQWALLSVPIRLVTLIPYCTEVH